MENELKPCPFCGGDACKSIVLPRHGEKTRWRIICFDCDARSSAMSDIDTAIEAWNRRVEDSVDGVRCKVCYWYDKQERTCLLYNEDERKENQ